MKLNPMLQTDFYKIVHKYSYVENLEYLTNYWTPRKSRLKGVNKVVNFGLQAIIKEKLIEDFNSNFFKKDIQGIINEYIYIISNTMDIGKDITKMNMGINTLKELHSLGYLPIQIKAIEEGKLVPIGVPMFEITNTLKGYGWLVNYLETYISCNIWSIMTSATISNEFKKLANRYFEKTSDNLELAERAFGDFSMRGMTSVDSAIHSSAGHLLSFKGTATIPSIFYVSEMYNTPLNNGNIGLGTSSMEHSVMSSYGKENEFESYKRLINEIFPKGNLSIVSDTYDYWKVIEEYLPKLKENILNRDGTIFIRGDSGDPIDIIAGKEVLVFNNFNKYNQSDDAYNRKKVFYIKDESSYIQDGNLYQEDDLREYKGTVELLWEIFGGTINSKGYKVLPKQIRAIYGDSITLDRAREIYRRLESKGFSVENVVLGIGSYTFQYNTRDTLGFALKATHAIVDGEEREIFKEPKTDKDNFKKSYKGKVVVLSENNNLYYQDGYYNKGYEELESLNQLKLVFKDSKMIKEYDFKTVRENLKDEINGVNL